MRNETTSANILQFQVKNSPGGGRKIAQLDNLIYLPRISEHPLFDFLVAWDPSYLERHNYPTHFSENQKDEMLNLNIIYNVKILRSRLAEEWHLPGNQEYRLCVFDRSEGQWVAINDLDGEGEKAAMMYAEEPEYFEVTRVQREGE